MGTCSTLENLSSYNNSIKQSDIKPADLYKILGSMKITGFGSRILLSKRPLAWMGERGITI